MTRETASVSRSVRLNAPPREVWELIGNFHRPDEWHPAIASSERAEIGEDEFRVLTTQDGARILEHMLSQESFGYTYAIVRSPLPVAHYESRLKVASAGDGSEVTWSGSFTPTAEGAEKAIAGIYEAGLGALKERFGG